jgi:ankyrin repeat protein
VSFILSLSDDTSDMIWMCRTALHRALYWGHLAAAALLLEAGAQLHIHDLKVRAFHSPWSYPFALREVTARVKGSC